jgi:hypothetical protein
VVLLAGKPQVEWVSQAKNTTQNLKIPDHLQGDPCRQITFPVHLFRSPDHPLDNLAFIFRFKECFLPKHARNSTF